MKTKMMCAVLLSLGLAGLAAWNLSAADRTTTSLGGDGWKLWLDRDAPYERDTLYVAAADSAKIKAGEPGWWTPVDVSAVPVNPPTCGWASLFSKSVAAASAEKAWRDRALSVDVSVPGTVEEYFFDAISGGRKGDHGSGDYRGVSWWGRTFDVPASARGRRVALFFKEGVRYRVEVFVNRTLAAYDLSEHSPLEVDITKFVKCGGRNELAVRITDATGEFSWGEFIFEKWGSYLFPASHGFGGIMGDVELVVTDNVRVDDIFVMNRTKPREIETRIEIANAADAPRTVYAEAEIVENWAANKKVANPKTVFRKKIGAVSVPAKGVKSVDFSAVVDGVRLWDIGDANLYDMRVLIKDAKGALVDSRSIRFGFKNFEVRGVGSDAQFWLNGRRVFLLSAISWGYWPSNGMIPTPALARKHVESAKALGMNMINFHRCRGNNAVLDAADEMGVLYYEEPGGYVSHRHKPDEAKDLDDKIAFELCRQKFLRMVKDHRNHPSLTIYNMVNEPGFGPDGRAKDVMACGHALDPSRLMVYGSGFMGAGHPQDIKLHMRPFDMNQYDVGFCDIHNAGNSPGVYVDSNYNSPRGFLRSLRDEKEILVWGEEGALASPPQLELIREQKRGSLNGWDGQQYDLWYEGYRSYIDGKGLAKNFPSMTDLITSMGNVMYYEHGRILENVRIADGAEAYILNGYESMKDDNTSGAVDCYRNHKGDPTLISRYMKPLVMSVKAREKLGEVGDVNAFDLWVLNNYAIPAGEYTVSSAVKTPSGKVRRFPDAKVNVSGGEKFSDLAAEGIEVKLDDGPGYYRIAAALKDGAGKVLANGTDEMFAVDYRRTKVSARGAIVGRGPEYVSFAKNVLKSDLRAFEKSMGRLDYILLAPTDHSERFKTIPYFAFRAKDGKTPGLDLEYFRGKRFEQKVDHRVSTAPIDFNIDTKPIPGYDILGSNDFSLRWEGYIASDCTGEVEFEYSCDDGARVWFDGELVVDKWSDGPRAENRFKRMMKAGEPHAVKIEAYQSGGEWVAEFRWKLPLPKQDVDMGEIVRRVRDDGTKLIVAEGTETWLAKLREAGAFPEYKVFHPNKTWVGHSMFVKKHPFFDGLPTDCAMNWEYQTLVVYDGPKHIGLLMEGEEPVVGIVGVPLRGIATYVGIVPCGKGEIAFSSLDLAPNLASGEKNAVTAKKIFANIVKWAGAKGAKDVKTFCNPMPLPDIPVSCWCLNPTPGRPGGAGYREIADPSFIYENGNLYLFPSMGMAWRSSDCGATWEKIDVGVRDLGYAPTVVKHRGRFYLMTGGSDLHAADSVEGPYKPIGRIERPKINGREVSYDDVMLFSDDDERLYAYFGCSPRGGIWGIELDADNPLAIAGEPKHLIKFEPEEHPWECKPNNLSEAWMEGSWMIKINGRYCLVYSSSGTENDTYAMGAAWSDKPLGPFVKQRNNPFLRSTTGVVRGTSHGSVVPDPMRKDRFLVAYSILVGERASFERLVGFDRIRLDANGEIEVTTPTSTPQYADGSGMAPWYRLPFVNAEHPEMSDENLRTGAPLYEFGAEPVFRAKYSAVVRAVRLIWTDRGIDVPSGVVPGPIQYEIQYRLSGKTDWKTLVDRTKNDKDLMVDYVETPRVRADELRLRVKGAPKGIQPVVADISVFVE